MLAVGYWSLAIGYWLVCCISVAVALASALVLVLALAVILAPVAVDGGGCLFPCLLACLLACCLPACLFVCLFVCSSSFYLVFTHPDSKVYLPSLPFQVVLSPSLNS